MNEGILTRSRFRNKTLSNQAIFLFSISTTFITPPNYYMWLHVIAFLVPIVSLWELMTLGAIFDPRGMIGRIYIEDHYTLLHTKYESFGPCGSGEDFLCFS